MSMHTRGTLVQFGAEAMIPTFQSAAFFNELGPLVTALLVVGRVGAAIGPGLTNMRVTEQIDAIESLSVAREASPKADKWLTNRFFGRDPPKGEK
jgi:phospholipid/cholesterol/gamma-HCH transport system permease protein